MVKTITTLAVFFLMVVISGSWVFAGTCGSDGPVPFLNISGSFNPPVSNVGTVGSIENFLFWENQNILVYRNNLDELRGTFFDKGYDWKFSGLDIPLARLVDERERFVITKDGSWFYDVFGQRKWIKIWEGNLPPAPLFWNKDVLYLLDNQRTQLGGQHLTVYHYIAGSKNTAKMGCEFVTSMLTKELKLAEGHVYPYMFFYQVHPGIGANGPRLSFHRMSIHDCRLEHMGEKTEVITGDIERVIRFDALDAFMVKTSDKEKNLRWEQKGKCNYFYIGDNIPIFPSFENPTMVSWSEKEGLFLYHLEQAKKARVLNNCSLEGLREDDLWYLKSEHRLMLAPQWKYSHQRLMITLDLDGF